MKQKLIIFFTLLVISNAFAQVEYGIYIGSGILNIKSDQLEFQKSKPSFTAGMSVDYLMTEKFEIIVEAGYSSRKPIFKAYDNHNLTNPHEVTLNYAGMDYNILANYNFFEKKISAQAGFYGNTVISNNHEALSNTYIKGFSDISKVKPNYGMLFGLSGGKENLRLNLRYGFSLSNPYFDVSYLDENDNQIDVIGKHHFINFSIVYYMFI